MHRQGGYVVIAFFSFVIMPDYLYLLGEKLNLLATLLMDLTQTCFIT